MRLVPDTEETQLQRRFGVAATLFTVLFVILMSRFFYLQIIKGDENREQALESFTTTVRLSARRGRILDRKGEVLAKNVEKHVLNMIPHKLRDPKVRSAVLDELQLLLGLEDARVQEVEAEILERIETRKAWEPVRVKVGLTSGTCPHDGEPLTLDTKVKHVHDGLAKNLICTKCKRHYIDEVAVVRSRGHELPGVAVTTTFLREYPYRYLASHLLGSVNKVNAEDRKRSPGVYALNAHVGRSGVERAMESVLRGEPGEAEYEIGADGRRPKSYRAAVPGRDVWLTIDRRLQNEVRQALRYHRSGSAVMLDPKTGEILAEYSTPGFDPNIWSGRLTKERYEVIKANPYSPMLNKGLTAYAPGSVYKIVTALAGLDMGLIDPEEKVTCTGSYHFAGDDFPCNVKTGHGSLTMVEALKYSCNVYFYKLGERITMDKLAEYGERFGYGGPTGIEVAERTGRVPTKAYHAETTVGWQPGFTLSTAIGQGSLTATPLQVARAFAALANGGRMVDARLVRQFTDERGELVQRMGPVLQGTLPGTPEHHAIIREGLIRVVNDANGTAPDVAMDAFVVAGKTGTAQAAQVRPDADEALARWLLDDHAWFAAYAPAEDPQVVVVVFLEHGGGGGRNASPVAKRLLEQWFRLGMYRAPAPTQTPSAGDATRTVPGRSE
ncbi:MAG: penicillin-binding protein 2 [Myxococcota bacterium]|jgi:penicillin-binding protein 2